MRYLSVPNLSLGCLLPDILPWPDSAELWTRKSELRANENTLEYQISYNKQMNRTEYKIVPRKTFAINTAKFRCSEGYYIRIINIKVCNVLLKYAVGFLQMLLL